jgi:hypothetical protein
MRKLLLGSICLFGLLAYAQTGSIREAVTAGDIDSTISARPGGRGALLFDSGAGVSPPAFAVVSQHFTDAILATPFDTYGADDFTVPDCGWEVTTVTAYGNYSSAILPPPLGPATSVNVYFVAKTGTTLTSTDLSMADVVYENLPYTELDLVDGGDFSISIPPTVLTKGDWWIVVQANMDILVGGQWNWTESSLTPNSGTTNGDESNWFQTSNPDISVVSPVTGTTTCVDAWGRRVTDCSMTRSPDSEPPSDRDFAFSLEGEILLAGVSVDPVVLNTTEDGSNATYNVVLTSPPCPGETVTVTPASGDVTEGTVSGAIMFTTANWDIPQVVTVTPGASGDGNDGDVMYAITNAVSTSDPAGCYPMVTAADVDVTNQNIEGVATITVDPSSGLMVDEDGGMTAMFTVECVGTPAADVSVGLTPVGDVTLSAASAVMTVGNGYSVDITVSGVSDDVVDGNLPFSVTTDPSSSADLAYDGVDPVNVSGTVLDNDVAAVTVTPTPSPLATTEAGGTSTISYVLTAMPSADVNITVGVNDATEASVDMTSLTFTSGNWSTPQVVTVTGEDDDIDDGTQPFEVINGDTTSDDGVWDGVAVANVMGNNADDADTAGFSVDDMGGVVTDESGTTDTFTVVADSEPVFDVSIDIRSGNIDEGLVSDDGITFMETITLTFTPGNWDTPQTVTVQGQDDAIRDDGPQMYTIFTENVTSFDPTYDVIADAAVADITATNNDDDPAAALVIAPGSLTMQEDSAPMTFSVNLLTQPTAASVTVPITSGDLTEATVSPSSLTFTDVNYGTPQMVTVTPVLDFIIDGDITFDVTVGPASGGNYTGISGTVSVTVENIDVCEEMTLDVEIGEPIIAYGTPTCVFDLYKTNNSGDTADWTYLGTFQVGGDGSVDTGVIAEEDCAYVTTISTTFIVLTPYPFATVPTLGQWGMIALVSLLAMAGIFTLRRRKAVA